MARPLQFPNWARLACSGAVRSGLGPCTALPSCGRNTREGVTNRGTPSAEFTTEHVHLNGGAGLEATVPPSAPPHRCPTPSVLGTAQHDIRNADSPAAAKRAFHQSWSDTFQSRVLASGFHTRVEPDTGGCTDRGGRNWHSFN
jgi:hypothetical protein